MKSKNYKYILLFITITILATVSLQIYWNLKNFEENKRRLMMDVQIAFDNSIEHYYAEDIKDDFISFIGTDSTNNSNFIDNAILDTTFENSINQSKKRGLKKITSLKINNSENKNRRIATIENAIDTSNNIRLNVSTWQNAKTKKNSIKISSIDPEKISSMDVIKGKPAYDSISKLTNFTNKIIISMRKDSIEFDKIEKTLNKELIRKNISILFGLQHFKSDTIFQNYRVSKDLSLNTFSNSTFLPPNQKLKLLFSDPTFDILKRSMTEILLSLFLSLSIIFCLLYLLKTINRQKKIDEMKNDLISNITHEFKTPITTVSTALEGIKNFNAIDDKEKTTRYIDISNQQLKKLEIMVEKLLETASLETDKIILNKETIDLVELLRSNIEKHEMNSIGQNFSFNSDFEEFKLNVDAFHLENAISNILDNAVKYGGTSVEIFLKTQKDKVLISIEDNGKGIDKKEREKIFEKFYRIQKGNIHDVKGFGIGLYYSKKIIEKHNGTLELIVNSKTIFKILLPNE